MPNSRSDGAISPDHLFDALGIAEAAGERAVARWGAPYQILVAAEEASEFVRAIARYQSGRGDWDDVVDEAADAILTALQIAHMEPGGIERLAEALRSSAVKLERHLKEAGEP
jgi:NTP pyrophosphatase (non-canonical NTP hydrolase)